MNTTYDIAAQVADVNTLLKNGEPGNISTDNSASYASFTGYKPQAIIDAMNEVFGYGNWGFEEISNEALLGAEKGGLTISQVRVFLKECAFQPTGWGQARITKGDIGDAKKGAQTDALKKALSYFSIGNRAYHGLLPVTQEQNQQAGRQQRSPAVQSNTAKPVQKGNLSVVPPSLRWSDIYREGAKKGMWTKESFYAIASACLNGVPINAENVKSLTQEQLQKLLRDVERYQPEQQAQ